MLEKLSRLEQMVFDKTGTLTQGRFRVERIISESMEPEELLRLVSAAEQYSAHPAAKAICACMDHHAEATGIEELPGYGIRAVVEGKVILAGNRRLMERHGVTPPDCNSAATCIDVMIDGVYGGRIELKDQLREDAVAMIRSMKELGVRRTVMLSGDVEPVVREIASELCLDNWRSALLPQDKVAEMGKLIHRDTVTAYVGDGVNDAPVLAVSDVGIALGGVGSDAAVEAADVVILHDRLAAIPELRRIAGKTMRIAIENIVFALGIKILVLILGAFGAANMWMAVFADVGVSILAILNAMRTLRTEA